MNPNVAGFTCHFCNGVYFAFWTRINKHLGKPKVTLKIKVTFKVALNSYKNSQSCKFAPRSAFKVGEK